MSKIFFNASNILLYVYYNFHYYIQVNSGDYVSISYIIIFRENDSELRSITKLIENTILYLRKFDSSCITIPSLACPVVV